jgi:hypothetical protein
MMVNRMTFQGMTFSIFKIIRVTLRRSKTAPINFLFVIMPLSRMTLDKMKLNQNDTEKNAI